MQKHHGSIIKVVYTSTIFLIFLSHIIVLCEKCAKMYKWFWVSYSIKRSQFDQNVNISWNHRKPKENQSKLKSWTLAMWSAMQSPLYFCNLKYLWVKVDIQQDKSCRARFYVIHQELIISWKVGVTVHTRMEVVGGQGLK